MPKLRLLESQGHGFDGVQWVHTPRMHLRTRALPAILQLYCTAMPVLVSAMCSLKQLSACLALTRCVAIRQTCWRKRAFLNPECFKTVSHDAVRYGITASGK
eukprot:4627514-Amphidinium_carterae.1